MHESTVLIFIVGLIIIACILVNAGFAKIGLPSLVGYLLLGTGIRFVDSKFGFLSGDAYAILNFLGSIGIIALLFRVGLESNLKKLIERFRSASLIWASNLSISWLLGYLAAYYLLEFGLITSLITATALSATSVGVPVGAWQEYNALDSDDGRLMIDVAEMDDISAIFLMALLFSVIPAIEYNDTAILMNNIFTNTGIFIFKFLSLAAFCYLFATKIESHLTGYLTSFKQSTELMLVTFAIASLIAALAGLIGFSIAIGAFFAGLVFSRDPNSVNIDASFTSLYKFFTPFFFIGIGLSFNPDSTSVGIVMGVVLILAAVLGKVIGAGVPAYFTSGTTGALLLGVSMVPRAEICMIIMQKGLELGDRAVPDNLFSGMVLVSVVTCLISIFFIKILLRKKKQQEATT